MPFTVGDFGIVTQTSLLWRCSSFFMPLLLHLSTFLFFLPDKMIKYTCSFFIKYYQVEWHEYYDTVCIRWSAILFGENDHVHERHNSLIDDTSFKQSLWPYMVINSDNASFTNAVEVLLSLSFSYRLPPGCPGACWRLGERKTAIVTVNWRLCHVQWFQCQFPTTVIP